EELVFEPNEAKKYLREPNFFERIGEFKSAAAAVGLWAESTLEALVIHLAEEHEVRSGDFIHAVRWAISGRSVGPSFYAMLRVLGKERVLRRLQLAGSLGVSA
ncbi:MAG: hypothetical protein LBD54_01395, partial [Puniceicoccales bacterium]|nr:hypothetical protein [Puniceicoccales bacterium]